MTERAGELHWHRSTWCASTGCVEVAQFEDTVLLRDSKDPQAGRLAFKLDDWAAFVAEIRSGGLRREG